MVIAKTCIKCEKAIGGGISEKWDPRPETRDPFHRWDPGPLRWNPRPNSYVGPGILKKGPETWDPESGFSGDFLSFLWRLAYMDEFMRFMRLCLFCMFIITLS